VFPPGGMVAKEECGTGKYHTLEFGVELQERLKLRNCLPQEAEASIITQIRAVKPKSAIYFIRFVLDSIINQER
jgi:hypothetical protein